MHVTLAYEYAGHQPDETVDFPDSEARQLIRDGWARLPDPASAAGTVDEVLAAVAGDPVKAQAALDAENASDKPRSTLVAALTDLTRAPDSPTGDNPEGAS